MTQSWSNEDTPVNINPLSNDDDGAGVDSVTVVSTPDPATEGELTYVDASGVTQTVAPGEELTPAEAATLTFIPVENFNGPVTPIEYTLTDVNGEESSAQILIVVTPTPDAVDDPVTTNEDTPVLLDPLANDDLADGVESVTVNNVPDPTTEGELTYLDPTGNPVVVTPGVVLTPEEVSTLTFTPVENSNGTVPPINYTVTDVNGEESSADILIEVTPTPDAMDDFNATSAGIPVTGNVLLNDSDDPAEILTVTEVNGIPIGNGPIATNRGTVLMNADGTYTFTPLPGMAGIDTFTYTVVDSNGVESEATVTIGIADLGVAKSVVGSPVLQSDGSYLVTYQVVVENTGAFDFADLSLVEDLAGQFGSALLSAGGLEIVQPTNATGSSIAVDTNWNGDNATELLASGSTLAAGDSFTLEFEATVDPSAFASTDDAGNSVEGSGQAVDADGTPITDANGDFILVSDTSDSGTDPSGSNIGEPGDTFGSDDATPLYIPSIGVAKQAGDAIAVGDNFNVTFTLVLENNGSVDLTNLTLFDDAQQQLGAAFVDAEIVGIQNFSGTGSAPTINSAWSGDTSQTLIAGGDLHVGDSFEVVYTVTIDPDATGTSSSLSNQATASGEALDENGDRLTDDLGNPIVASDDSDSGSDPNGENGEEVTEDGIFANDATDILIADLGIAKSLIGEPVLTELGNFVVTYQLVVANTGTVDLASISLLEDLATQFGSSLVDAGNLTLVSGPSNPSSSVAVDSANFNGTTNIELIDGATASLLASGDSFTVQFDIEIDPREIEDTVGNQVTGSAGAVGANGDPLLDSNSNPIVGTDISDSGTDPTSTNPDSPDDQGTSSDATVLNPPEVPLGEISGTVFQDDNGDGELQPGEGGIAGVEIILTGTDVLGNSVEITVLTDANGRYTFAGLNAGTYSVTQIQPEGFTDGEERGNSDWTIGDDQFSNIVLGWGEVFSESTFAERLPGASGNPPRLPSLPPIANNRLSDLLGVFGSSPSTIYSGIPINSNGNPLSFDSGRAITGGFSSGLRSAAGGSCSYPLIWSMHDVDFSQSHFTIHLDGPLGSGQSASVQLTTSDGTLDYSALQQSIAQAVAAYNGPGLVSFDGATLTFTSTDGSPMQPILVELQTVPAGGSPDAAIDMHSSGNSEINEDDMASEEQSELPDGQDGLGSDTTVGDDVANLARVPFLKRFANWLVNPTNVS